MTSIGTARRGSRVQLHNDTQFVGKLHYEKIFLWCTVLGFWLSVDTVNLGSAAQFCT